MSDDYALVINELNLPGRTLWLADESATQLIQQVAPRADLIILTQRYDTYLAGNDIGHNILFNDFDFSCLSVSFNRIVIRLAKEKDICLHWLTSAQSILDEDGTLVLIGQKKEGIKRFDTWLRKKAQAKGSLKKLGLNYLGHYSKAVNLNETSDYHTLHTIPASVNCNKPLVSKPGVFGWNKIDKGSEQLVCAVEQFYEFREKPSRLLDIGCGYGYLITMLSELVKDSILGVDNNAAALRAAKENIQGLGVKACIKASHITEQVDYKFDCIVCNPPFHQGFDHHVDLTEAFAKGASKVLQADIAGNAQAFFVVNQFIGIERHLVKYFSHYNKLSTHNGFSIYNACKQL